MRMFAWAVTSYNLQDIVIEMVMLLRISLIKTVLLNAVFNKWISI